MAQLLVRNLEIEVKVRLQQRAESNGRSMEEEARDILRDALKDDAPVSGGLGSEIAALFQGLGFEEGIAELRGYDARPAEFEK